MSVYRSYFAKNNTLIQNNELNVSQNPVGEISYGTLQKTVSRIIFKADLSLLAQKLIDDGIDITKIVSHRLGMTNTVSQTGDIGGFSYSKDIERATSFGLELFEITEDWDEGGGYTFQFNDNGLSNLPQSASNWKDRKTAQAWTVEGAFISGTSEIIGTQSFQKGNENIDIDVTDYINNILFSGGTDYGLGLKMTDQIEVLETIRRRSVAFHMKNTNTTFEPYIETIIEDGITDDRNFFFMDKDNDLYLYSNKGDVSVSGVTIYDYENEIVQVIPASGVTRVKKGVYKITVNISSDIYPDAVIFKDVWTVFQNSKEKEISFDFYLVNSEKFYSFGLSNRINPDNYHFSYFGILSGEYLKRGDLRRITLTIKQLYKGQDNNLPLNLEYRLFIKQSTNVEIDIIPYTSVDRTSLGYEFTLDTSWLIPQDYYIDLKISDGAVFMRKTPIGFTIVSDEAFTKS